MAVSNIGTPRTLAGEDSFDGDNTQTTPVPNMASSMMMQSTPRSGRNNHNYHHNNSHMNDSIGENKLVSTPRLQKPAGQREFTPLMKSVLKNNANLRSSAYSHGHGHANSPATGGGSARKRAGGGGGGTPRTSRNLDVIEEDESVDGGTQSTPVPNIASSMMQATPMSEKENNLVGDGQAMTLREQEQVINKIDKENFSLKLKVHFLEQRLRKAGDGDFEEDMRDLPAKEQIIYESAKKEKNLKITIRELKRRVVDLEQENNNYAKSNNHRASTSAATHKLREEIEDLRNELLQSQRDASDLRNRSRELENAALKEIQRAEQFEKQNRGLRDVENQLASNENAHAEEVASLKDEISDLEYALRQKERISEELAERGNTEVSDELEAVRQRHAEEVDSLRSEIDGLRDAMREKERAFDDLAERKNAGSQEFSEELRSIKKRHEDEVQNLYTDIGNLRYRLREKEQALDDAVTKNDAGSQGFSDELKTIKRRHAEEASDLRDEIQTLRATLQQRERAFDEVSQRNNIVSQEYSEKLRSVKQRHAEEVDRLRAEIDNLRDSMRQKERAFDELAERKNVGSQEFSDELRFAKRRHAEEVDNLRADIDNLRDTMRQKETIFDDLLEKERHAAATAQKNESNLKELVRQLKTRVAELESENYGLLVKDRTKTTATPSKRADEVANLRSETVRLRDALRQKDSMTENLLDKERRETALVRKSESNLQDLVRQLRSRITELENENRDIRARERGKPAISPTQNRRLEDEARQLRKELLEWQKTARDLRNNNHTLQDQLRDANRRDVRDELKTATLEAESLLAQLSERDARVQSLRRHLDRMRNERTAARTDADKLREEMAIVRKLQTACSKERDALREDFGALESQYAAVVDELYQQQSDSRARHAKEFQGLGKEIQWLRAKLHREERFRTDLVYSKGFMELNERVRVACIETDLKMIQEMQVDVRAAGQQHQHNARQKFRAAVWAVVFVSRTQRLKDEWIRLRGIGQSLGRAKARIMKNRMSQKDRIL